MIDKVKRGEISRAQQRAMAAAAVEASVDAQGRINIERELRDFAGLEAGTTVVVAGSFDRVEIWNAAAYSQQTEMGGAAIRGAVPM